MNHGNRESATAVLSGVRWKRGFRYVVMENLILVDWRPGYRGATHGRARPR
jgi:hypothetical protein